MPVPTTRGIGSNEEDAEHDVSAPENPEDMMHSYTNLILINGCAPNKTVPGYSFIAEGFLKTLEECRSNNGTLLIPDSNQILNTFRPNSEGNLTFEIAEPLLLHGPDPTEDQMPTKLLALAEKLKDQFETLESEKLLLKKKAEEQDEEAKNAELEQQKLSSHIESIQAAKDKF